MKTKNILKISQIGVGYWGPNLLRNMFANKHCKVKTVVDLSKERRNFVNELYPSIKVSNKIEDIINDSDIEAVVISTPVATHFEISKSCLESGKHILVEKPMALTTNEIKQLDELAKKNDLVAMVGHTFLYNSSVRYVKKLIDSNELGDIRYIYSQRVNLGRIRSDVDAMWNLAPHDISIIQYWLNEEDPIEVNRFGQSFVQDNIDDVVFLNILYRGGIIANIHVSWLDPHKIRKMTVVGSKKMVVYDDIAKNKVIIYDKGIDRMAILGENMDFDDATSFSFTHRSGKVEIPDINWEEPLKKEIEHFIECITKGTKCLTDTKHAEKVVNILTKA